MDVLNFDPAAVSGDTTTEVEGYDDHVEEIEQAYPEQDFRTPAEIEEEQQVQTEGQAVQPEQPTEVTPTEVVEGASPVTDEFFGDASRYNPNLREGLTHAAGNQYGYIPTELLKDRDGKPIPEGIIRTQNLNFSYTEKEHKLWENYKKNGGDLNLENQLATINAIRNDPELLVRYDRNQDGEFTISDWHDMTRTNLTQAEDRALTQRS